MAGFKCFLLPSGVDEFAPLDAGQLAAAMAEIASFGGLLIAHAEDAAVIAAARPAHGRRYAEFLASRPPEAEVSGRSRRCWPQTRRTGCRTHIVHLSSRGRAGRWSARPRRPGCRSPPRPARIT